MVASSAQASTSSVTLGFPSLTLIQNATIKPAIPVTYKVDGLNSALVNVTLVPTITNSEGTSVLGTTTSTFFSDDTALNTQGSVGVSAFNLQNGAEAAAFTGIAAGTYTLTVTAVSTTTGVAVATSAMPFAVVTTAAAGTVAGTASFVDAQTLTAKPVTSRTYATGSAVSAAAPAFVALLNSAGGPIVSAPALVTGTATPTSGAGNATTFDAATASAAAPGIYSLPYAGAETWSATAGAGSIRASFASPVNQVIGTLPVTLAATATMNDLDIASAATATVTTADGGAADDSIAVPATTGVKFTVSGIMKTGSPAAATAGVGVSFAVTGVDDTNTAPGTTAYSAIAPATATSVLSNASGLASLEYTVTNPVAGKGARVTATFPGGTKTFFVKFVTPVTTTVSVNAANVTASTTGTVALGAVVTDNFGKAIAGVPVAVNVTGVAATSSASIQTSDAQGRVSYTITVPAGTVNNATSSVTFGAWNGTSYATTGALFKTVAVTYTTGSVAPATITATGGFNEDDSSTFAALKDGALNTNKNPLYVNTQADLTGSIDTGANDYWAWGVKAVAKNAEGTVIAGTPVTITPAAGAFVLNADGEASTSETVFTGTDGAVTFKLTALKTGDLSYTITAGSATSTVKAHFSNRATDARYVAISSSADKVAAGTGATITASVKDRFDNPVAGVTLTLAQTGPGYIAGSGTVITDAAGIGQATFVTVAGLTGTATITALGANAQTVSMPTAAPSTADQVFANATLALQLGNAVNSVTSATFANPAVFIAAVTVDGVTKGEDRASTAIEVGTEVAKSIAIVGERTTVSGKSGIRVEGVVEGIEDGKTVTPFIRFPGQTTFTAGSARPAITDGEVIWQRKTGKRVTVYLELSDDAAVRSNRVTIQAK